MAVWPPYAQIASIGEDPQSALIRTPMESGPPKQAKVRSKQMINRPLAVALDSKSDYLSFRAWVDHTLNRGRDWFSWADPVDDTVKQARILNGAYKGRPLGNRLTYWEVTLTLETLE